MSDNIDKIKTILDMAESNIDEVKSEIESQEFPDTSSLNDVIDNLNSALQNMPDPSDISGDEIDSYPLVRVNEYIEQVRNLLDEITSTATFDFNSRNAFADKYQMVNRQAKYISQDVASGVEDIATNMLFNTATTDRKSVV